MTQPYPVPRRLPPHLERVLAYWRGLLRGSATIPFSDDINPSDLPDLVDELFFIEVFERPQRFRLNQVGKNLSEKAIAGKFLDEVSLASPLDHLSSQCVATVEYMTPTYSASSDSEPNNSARFCRLLLPLWADGKIALILGAVGRS